MTGQKQFLTYALIIIFISSFASFAYSKPINSLAPLLINLKGWKAEPAEGMNMNMNGIKMVNAVREYRHGNANVTATIMIGSNMMTQGQMQQMNIENSSSSMRIEKVNGFKIYSQHDKKGNTGVILIYLDKNKSDQALFIVSYEGLSEKDGLKFAKRFNWKKIKQATGKLL